MPQTFVLTRGRRLALGLGLPFALASVGFAGLNCISLLAQAKYDVGPTVLPAAAALSLSVSSGSISAGPSPDRSSHLEGTVNYSLIFARLSWASTPSGTVVRGPDCSWVSAYCGSDLRLALPAGEELKAGLGSGPIVVSHLSGRLQLEDGSGDITVGQASGPLLLGDSSGNITATGLASQTVNASDGSGDVRLGFSRPPEMVEAHDSSGNITVLLPGDAAYRIVAEASSGSRDVDVPTNPASHHVIELYDGSGNINIVPAKQ